MGVAATTVDPTSVIALLGDLVHIDSINPFLVPGAAGEHAIAAFIAERVAACALEVEMLEVAPGRPNVIARYRGRGGGRSLILNAHTDTVGVAGMHVPPFEARVEDGRLYGRGSADTKASLAAMIAAIEAVQSSGLSLRGDVILAAVADEEYSSLGTEQMVRTVQADACIIGEDTALHRMVAHQGFAWYEIETIGRAAHGMHPEQGIDAIAMMGRVLGGLNRLHREVISHDLHSLTGQAVFHQRYNSGWHGTGDISRPVQPTDRDWL